MVLPERQGWQELEPLPAPRVSILIGIKDSVEGWQHRLQRLDRPALEGRASSSTAAGQHIPGSKLTGGDRNVKVGQPIKKKKMIRP